MELRRPLLAAKTTDEDLRRLTWPMLASPKIDGIRALVVNGQLVSRTLKPIPNRYTQSLFGRPELEGLDGELVVGEPWDRNLMQQTTSGVMSFGGMPKVSYFVFDKWDAVGVFNWRTSVASTKAYLQKKHFQTPIEYVDHSLLENESEFITYEGWCLEKGYEGVMLRDPLGKYKQNRSTLRERTLLKVKRFHDAEAIIVSYSPLMRNENAAQLDERGYTKRSTHQDNKIPDSLLGSLCVRDCETGITFDIGTGFTEAQRQSLWDDKSNLLGRIIKYKSFAVGVKDKPRFPIFLGFRSPLDM